MFGALRAALGRRPEVAAAIAPSSAWAASRPAFSLVRAFASFIEIKMPALSPTMTQGNFVAWKKNVGDAVAVGEVLGEVETDKATLDFESPEEGFLAKVFVPAGSNDVPVGKLLAVLVEDKADLAAAASYSGESAAPAAAAVKSEEPKVVVSQPSAVTSATAAAVGAAPAAAAGTEGGRVVASPYARKLADEKGVSLSQVSGTGPHGRIVAADVAEFTPSAAPAAAAAAAAAAPSPAFAASAAGAFSDVPLSNMRKVIASRLLQSKQQIPHYYLTVDCNVDQVLKLREQLNAQAGGAYKLSVNDFVVKASALALRKVPTANASWMGDFIREYDYVDISVAVSTDNGLITPILKDADKKGLSTLSNDMKTLAEKARNNKLTPPEFQGGTFTISNLGMFGVKKFSAVINPPQSCILAVGSAEKTVVVNPKAKEGESPFTTATVMSVTLSCDHRVVDGAVGAQWLQAFKSYIENPVTMLL